MPLTLGTRLGPYEILSALGAGGMGEVYRARDTRLGREVAIKVLPEHLSAQPEIRARFEREARSVSALNHPNICVLHDVGREGDVDFLVMELVEGDTLADRLQKGKIPLAEQLRVGAQVADALDRAHRAGIVHRDLKPGNIMLTRAGAKLMDFGLASVVGVAGAGSSSVASIVTMTHSPTLAQPLTAQGALVGTFQYMSPEQLEGREADARSDIWALGCVLYEMASGRRPFDGRSQASLIAAVLERDPAPLGDPASGTSGVTSGIPRAYDQLIKLCLKKDPEDRIQTAHDVRLRLREIADEQGVPSSVPSSTPGTAVVRVHKPARLAWSLAAAGLLLAAGIFAWLYPRATRPLPVYHFRVQSNLHAASGTDWPRVSPDGMSVVFDLRDSSGVTRAWVRRFDEADARPIAGSEGVLRSYWSPDSREIAFLANGKIMRVPVAGGPPTIVCEAGGGADLSWGSSGMILMDGAATDSLRMVAASGGDLKPATHIHRKEGEVGNAWPHFLADGKHFLYQGKTDQDSRGGGTIRLGVLGSLDSKVLGHSDGRVEYAAGGWVVFVRGTSLVTQKLDLGAGKLVGDPVTITDHLYQGNGAGAYSCSPAGPLAFVTSPTGIVRALRLADRKGVVGKENLALGRIWAPRLSPDGKHMTLLKGPGDGAARPDVYNLDLERHTETRLTFGRGAAGSAAWSPDGRQYAYSLLRAFGGTSALIGAADGLGSADSLAGQSLDGASVFQWVDGSRLLASNSERAPIWVDMSTGKHAVSSVLQDKSVRLLQCQVSPDGRWLAGVFGNSTMAQVYVYSLTGQAGRWQISTDGGTWPKWTKGGREIIYEGFPGKTLMAVDIDLGSGFHPGVPHPLFDLPQESFTSQLSSWTCDPAGEKFFVMLPLSNSSINTFEVVSDFASLVKRK